MRFFGFTFGKSQEDQKPKQVQQLPRDENLDGALELSSGFTGWVGHGINFNEAPSEDEIKLVSKYREMSMFPEVERAVDDIINEAFSYTEEDYPVSVNLDTLEDGMVSDNQKDRIREEFNNVLDLLNFKNDCYEIFRRWYVDGRLYYQKIIDDQNPKNGLIDIQYIDPRKIKKIRQTVDERNKGSTVPSVFDGIDINKKYIEYYLYNPMGIQYENPTGLRITVDSIAFIHSGIHDKSNKVILSHLHKAIRPLNQMSMIENSLVIYRLARAPERRIFNVEVGKLPTPKVDQHMNALKNNHRRKMQYDIASGEVVDDKRYMTMLEDFWFPKRDGKGTTVETLQGGQNLGEMADVEYFKKKLIEALNIPTSRYEAGTAFTLGRSSEITRDELKFMKFVERLRKRFSYLFEDLLGTQLKLKNILTPEEWERIRGQIRYDYLEDNMFTELKWADIWNNRFATMTQAQLAVEQGYVSKNWIRETILHITDEDAEKMKKDTEKDQQEEMDRKRQEAEMMAQVNPSPFGQDDEDSGPPKPNPFEKKPKPPEEEDSDKDVKAKDDEEKPEDDKPKKPPFLKKRAFNK